MNTKEEQEGSAGFGMDVRFTFDVEKVGEGPTATFRPMRLGVGEYAHVFRASEVVQLDSSGAEFKRPAVAKIFRDDAPGDYKRVFLDEYMTMIELGRHENIVGFRGIFEEVPPSFVCMGCGEVLHRKQCPECGAGLQNHTGFAYTLCCRGKQMHMFQWGVPEQLQKLWSDRKCKCQEPLGPCYTINFLFRPCILLEELHVNLRQFAHLLVSPKNAVRGHRLMIPARGKTQQDVDENGKREKFLMVLDVLIKIAEALAYVHSRERLHGDIAPENVMILLAQPFAQEHADSQVLGTALSTNSRTLSTVISTKLVDFGRARPDDDPNVTGSSSGRKLFMAPERLMVEQSIAGSVSLFVESKVAKQGATCIMFGPPRSKKFLAVGDYLKDETGGEYTVLKMLAEVDKDSQETVRKVLGEQLCVLRVEALPHDVFDVDGWLHDVEIKVNQAIRIPSDIYALGCLALYLVTAGDHDVLPKALHVAGFSDMDKTPIDEVFTPSSVNDDFYNDMIEAIELPKTTRDNEVRKKILRVVASCLIRGTGAYCGSRSDDFQLAALKAVADLRDVYSHLFFLHRTQEWFNDWDKERNSKLEKYQAEMEELKRIIDAERSKTANANDMAARAMTEMEFVKNEWKEELKDTEKVRLLRANRALERAFHDLQTKYEERLSALKDENERALEALRLESAAQVSALEMELVRVREFHKQFVEEQDLACKRALSEKEVAHTGEIGRLRAEWEAEKLSLKDAHAEQEANRKKELDEKETAHAGEIGRLRAEWEAEKLSLKDAHAEQEANRKKELDEKETVHAGEIGRLRAEGERQRLDLGSEHAKQILSWAKALAEKEAAHGVACLALEQSKARLEKIKGRWVFASAVGWLGLIYSLVSLLKR